MRTRMLVSGFTLSRVLREVLPNVVEKNGLLLSEFVFKMQLDSQGEESMELDVSEEMEGAENCLEKIVGFFYPVQFSLADYLAMADNSLVVRQEGDTEEYRRLLRSTIVAIPRDQSPLKNPSRARLCSMSEVIYRVIETTLKSKSRHTSVLALGYERPRVNEKYGTVAGTIGIQNVYPNTVVGYLKTSQTWSTLHSRIGDDLMVHLLQNLALFVEMPLRCFLQVSGQPIHLLLPLDDNPTCQGRLPSNEHVGSTKRHSETKRIYSDASMIVPQDSDVVPKTERNVTADAVVKRKGRRRGGRKWRGYKARVRPGASDAPLENRERSACLSPQSQPLIDEGASPEIMLVSESSLELSPEVTIASTGRKRKIEDREDSQCEMVEDSALPKRSRRTCDAERDPGASTAQDALMSFSVGPANSDMSKTTSDVGERMCDARLKRPLGSDLKNSDARSKNDRRWLRKAFRLLGRRRHLDQMEREQADTLLEKEKKKTRTPPDQGNPSGKPSSEGKSPSRMYFPVTGMLFASSLRERLPKGHTLDVMPASRSGARHLIREIFLDTRERLEKTQEHAPRRGKRGRLPKRLSRLQGVFVRFLARHKKCRFRMLLRHHCPDQTRGSATEQKSTNNKSGKEENLAGGSRTSGSKTKEGKRNGPNVCSTSCKTKPEDRGDPTDGNNTSCGKEKNGRRRSSTGRKKQLIYEQAARAYTPPHKVLRFLKSICRKVVPSDLWGSSQNKKAFFKNFKKFLRLRQHENFSLAQMTHGVKVSACAWLRPKKTAGSRTNVSESLTQKLYLCRFIWWFVREYLMVILKSFFYITHSGLRRNHIFFYRKPVWTKIHNFGLKSLSSTVFQRIDTNEAGVRSKGQRSLEYSQLRFLPKATSVRPIANMQYRQPDARGKAISMNMKLRNLFEVLKYEAGRNRGRLGSGVLGADDVHQRLRPFVARCRSDPSPLYFVHVDISGCFDSIPHQKLYELMEDVLEDEEYLLRRFTVLGWRDGSVRKSFKTDVSESADCQTFPEFLRKRIPEMNLREAVIVDSVLYFEEDRDYLLKQLREHILNNVVKIASHYYRQTQGIAQGSILSSLLCNYFYGAMEKQYFPEILADPTSLLLRWVDDFLLITPSRPLAEKFLTTMHGGIPEFCCFVNSAKTLTNFDAVAPGGEAVRRIGSEAFFPWCGYLVDPTTLEVQYDYSRYSGAPISDTITSELNKHPGLALRVKLRHSVRTKAHPLLVSPELNSRPTVVLNAYRAFTLAATKLHAFSREMQKDHQAKDNPVFFGRTVLELGPYFYYQATNRCRQLTSGQASFELSEGEVTLLCCEAFVSTLQKKQSRYRELLELLRSVVKVLRRGPNRGLICPPDDLHLKLF